MTRFCRHFPLCADCKLIMNLEISTHICSLYLSPVMVHHKTMPKYLWFCSPHGKAVKTYRAQSCVKHTSIVLWKNALYIKAQYLNFINESEIITVTASLAFYLHLLFAFFFQIRIRHGLFNQAIRVGKGCNCWKRLKNYWVDFHKITDMHADPQLTESRV